MIANFQGTLRLGIDTIRGTFCNSFQAYKKAPFCEGALRDFRNLYSFDRFTWHANTQNVFAIGRQRIAFV